MSGSIFDASLVVDVRASDAYSARHVLGSVSVPSTVDRSTACKTIMSQKSQLDRLYVLVMGDDVASASSFATALVEHGVPFVAVIGTTAEVLFDEFSDASIVVESKKRRNSLKEAQVK